MQLRNQNRRHGLIATLPLAVLLAACAAAAPATSPTTAAATPTQIPAPTPSAVPTPASEPPLALFYNYSPAPGALQLEVINAKGVQQWGLTQAQEAQYFGLTATQYGPIGNSPQIGGADLFFFIQSTPTSADQVAVVSSTGALIGRGTAPAFSLAVTSPFQVSPIGTEWAWTTDETPNATGQHHGVVEVGGLGKTNRILYRWVAPVGFTEQLDGWTNTGIILQRIPLGGPFPCGGYDDATNAWFAINPGTGTLRELFTGNQQFIDASSGVTVAGLISDSHAILINGVQYSESNSIAGGASISPDGSEVAVFRETFNPCGGGNIPRNSIELINVANHSHVDLPDLGFPVWWNNQQILAVPTAGSLWFYTLEGKAVSELSPPTSTWNLIGVVS